MTVPSVPAPLSASPEALAVDPASSGVKCDGGGGALGHPLVYYSFDGKTSVRCLYCDRLFVKK
ncbi:MAG: zinc-finger domain-containing protein [Alphaproteobacteria bacterium]|jgi:uncharacterized Zn-finger protein|nr:zinc-finger domain-containing protein [Alphaproteobacteria bacterium]MCB1550898.1 zinc-finger domain-containing protein [Alphaproteobacteria bacterium]MCB9985783.1 zinc-finger domain-containing protein [Micavibrio sp.]HRK97585.1 zinc-finger domain-containing protein [Alphaproteobacteria bacterium]